MLRTKWQQSQFIYRQQHLQITITEDSVTVNRCYLNTEQNKHSQQYTDRMCAHDPLNCGLWTGRRSSICRHCLCTHQMAVLFCMKWQMMAGQTLPVHTPDGSTFLYEMTNDGQTDAACAHARRQYFSVWNDKWCCIRAGQTLCVHTPDGSTDIWIYSIRNLLKVNSIDINFILLYKLFTLYLHSSLSF